MNAHIKLTTDEIRLILFYCILNKGIEHKLYNNIRWSSLHKKYIHLKVQWCKTNFLHKLEKEHI